MPDKNTAQVKSTDLFEKFYRTCSKGLTKILVKTPITGNMVTVFRGLLFIPFCLLIAFYPVLGVSAWVAYLCMFIGIQLWDILDCTDGDLARAKQSASNLGGWLELLIDRPLGHTAGLFGFCLALGLYFELQTVLVWIFAFMIAVGWLLKTTFVYVNIIGELPESADKEWREKARKQKQSVIGKVLYFFHYRELGLFSLAALLFYPLSLLGINIMFWYLAFYAFLHNLIWVGLAFVQYQNLKNS